MVYRKDIDGLRAIAVVLVILFHTGVPAFRGGFIGVDVFFVISGYLITTLILQDIKADRFSYLNFYYRRAVRLLPALGITLAFVLLFGFLFYDSGQFDRLGKEIFFSSIGLANLYFSNGVDYFSNDVSLQPLLHLWSLGVEEQFYFIWPFTLLILYKYLNERLFVFTLLCIVSSLVLSELELRENTLHAYFLPQYRAFELLIGALASLSLSKGIFLSLTDKVRDRLGFLGLCFILISLFFISKNTAFPGYSALLPCLGAFCIIVFGRSLGLVSRLLSYKPLVLIGLISYPLYLYHQPVISVLAFFDLKLSPVMLFGVVSAICFPLAWITYQCVETPLRRSQKKSNFSLNKPLVLCVSVIPVFLVLGLLVAKGQGLPMRFKILNEFAYQVSENNKFPFHLVYERGYQVDEFRSEGDVLFVGDSVLQNYVPSMTNTVFKDATIDMVTRGGCVLLKGVEFKDSFSDISCNGLRERLYSSEKRYKTVVISQSWTSYRNNIKNFPVSGSSSYIDLWKPFLNLTIDHFKKYADSIVVLVGHPEIDGTQALKVNILATEELYRNKLNDLSVANKVSASDSVKYFSDWNEVKVINVFKMWCPNDCFLHDDTWSYFIDSKHISIKGSKYLESVLSDSSQVF